MEENQFKCTECKKYYKSYQSLWNHKKRFHDQTMTNNGHNDKKNDDQSMTNNGHIKKLKKTDNSTCEYCNKILSAYTHLRRHLKICKTKQNIIKQNEEIIKQQNEIIKQNNEIIKQNEEIINKTTTTNNGTINNNTNNGTINNTNNNINIFHFGSENILENLPTKESIKLLKIKGYDLLIKAITLTHFSKENPSGHNIYMNNVNDKYAIVYDNKKGKTVLEPTNEALDFTMQQRINEIEVLKIKYKDELDETELNNLEYIIENDFPSDIVNKTKKLACKHKDMVKETIDNVK